MNCNFIWLRLSWIPIYVLYKLTIDFYLLLFRFMAELHSYIMAHMICTTNSILPSIIFLLLFSLSLTHTHTLELQKLRFFVITFATTDNKFANIAYCIIIIDECSSCFYVVCVSVCLCKLLFFEPTNRLASLFLCPITN